MLLNNSTRRLQRVPEDDDDFGLSDFDINPIDDDDEASGGFDDEEYEDEEEESNSKVYIYYGVLALVLAVLGVGAYFGYQYINQDDEIVSQDIDTTEIAIADDSLSYNEVDSTIINTTNDAGIEDDSSSSNETINEDFVSDSEPQGNIGSGEFVELSSRSGNAHIVVGSFIDKDMATRYAQELSFKGFNPSIISPFGKTLFYRVTSGSYGSVAEAANDLGNIQGQLNADAWVINY